MNRKLLYIISFLLFSALIALPVVYTFISAFFNGDLYTNFSLLFTTEALNLLVKSVVLALSVAFLSTLIGGVLGFILKETKVIESRFFKVALLVPLFISPYILAVAWKDFFFFFFGNAHAITSVLGVVFVLSTVFAPLSMLIIASALKNIDGQLEEAGMVITNYKAVVFKIILPLIKPALMSSFVLVFIFAISEFSVPAFFGVKVMTTEIFTQFSAFYNHSLAILQSAVLVFICVFLLFSERKYIADAPFLSMGNKGHHQKGISANNGRLSSVLYGWLFISVVLPFMMLFIQAFKGGMSPFIQAFDLLLPTFAHSIALAFFGGIFIAIIGFSVAYLSTQRPKAKSQKYFEGLLLLVFAIPSTILGISFIKFYNHPMLDVIYSSSIIIILAYVAKYSFIAAKLISNAIKQIPMSLDESAQMQGITYTKRLRNIWLPLLLPSLMASFMIGFVFSLGELGTTIMLYPPGTQIMPIKVFTIMANAPQALTSSMILIVFSVTLLTISSFYFLANKFIKTND